MSPATICDYKHGGTPCADHFCHVRYIDTEHGPYESREAAIAGDPDARPARAPQVELVHDAAVRDEHERLARRANEVGLSVTLEEAAEAIVELRADAALVAPREPELEAIQRFASGEKVNVSMGVHEELTYGYGKLDANGFWEFPLPEPLIHEIFRLRQELRESAALVAGLRQELKGDEVEITSLRQQLREYEEREAACCPEDVGFEEVIARLRQQNSALEAERQLLDAEVAGLWAERGAPTVDEALMAGVVRGLDVRD